jgi:hypothetical protein
VLWRALPAGLSERQVVQRFDTMLGRLRQGLTNWRNNNPAQHAEYFAEHALMQVGVCVGGGRRRLGVLMAFGGDSVVERNVMWLMCAFLPAQHVREHAPPLPSTPTCPHSCCALLHPPEPAPAPPPPHTHTPQTHYPAEQLLALVEAGEVGPADVVDMARRLTRGGLVVEGLVYGNASAQEASGVTGSGLVAWGRMRGGPTHKITLSPHRMASPHHMGQLAAMTQHLGMAMAVSAELTCCRPPPRPQACWRW